MNNEQKECDFYWKLKYDSSNLFLTEVYQTQDYHESSWSQRACCFKIENWRVRKQS